MAQFRWCSESKIIVFIERKKYIYTVKKKETKKRGNFIYFSCKIKMKCSMIYLIYVIIFAPVLYGFSIPKVNVKVLKPKEIQFSLQGLFISPSLYHVSVLQTVCCEITFCCCLFITFRRIRVEWIWNWSAINWPTFESFQKKITISKKLSIGKHFKFIFNKTVASSIGHYLKSPKDYNLRKSSINEHFNF